MKEFLPMYPGASDAVNELLHRFAIFEHDTLFRVAADMAERDVADCQALVAHLNVLLVHTALADAKDQDCAP